MAFDPARTSWIANEWYWRITENAATLTVELAARDFVRPLVRLLGVPVDVIGEGASLVVTLEERSTRIVLAASAIDRVAINHLISDLDRWLATEQPGLAFAIVVPRRYELCGVLITTDQLDRLYGDPQLLVPSSRTSWKALQA
jgi:hypothetical protein